MSAMLPYVNLHFMRKKAKKAEVKKFIRLKNEYSCSLELFQLILKKIEQSTEVNEKYVDVLLMEGPFSFYPGANIEEILRILLYERKFEASIKLNHYYCKCPQDHPPCCRWLTVKNTWS